VAGRAADGLSDGLVEVSRVGGWGAAESLPDDWRQEVGGVLHVVAAGNSGRVPEEKRSYCGQKKATC